MARIAAISAALFLATATTGCGEPDGTDGGRDDASRPDGVTGEAGDGAARDDVPSGGDTSAPDGAAPDTATPDATSGTDAATDAPPDGPWVRILVPSDGARVTNVVAFRVAAGGVRTVRLFNDEWPMSAAWDPATRDNLAYTFVGPARMRQVRLLGLDMLGAERARHSVTVTAEADGVTDAGTALPSMYNTYYYLARQADYTGALDTTLYDGTCRPIAMVPAAYSDSVCIEGSGVLTDGRIINYSSSCTCGRRCPTGGTVCYSVLDGNRYPWGSGASAPLVPLRSWAVDRTFVALGTTIYVPRWDGTAIPAVDGLGGFTHDGCFRADDTGGAIRGNHFDFFAGTRNMWRSLERIYPTMTTFAVQRNAGRCAYLR